MLLRSWKFEEIFKHSEEHWERRKLLHEKPQGKKDHEVSKNVKADLVGDMGFKNLRSRHPPIARQDFIWNDLAIVF